MPKYSIIIAVKNSIEVLVNCIQSIQAYTKNYELILVDGGSTDGSWEYMTAIKEQNPNVKLIPADPTKNRNFAQQNNVALPYVEGEYIIFLNSDTVVSRDWCVKMEAHFHNVPLHNIGAVGPVCNMSNGRQMVGKQNADDWYQKNRGRWSHAGVLYGWCMMFKKEVIDRIGGFDEQFVNAYEDNDLSLRTQLEGYQMVIAYDTYIDHVGQATLRKTGSLDDYMRNGYENRERYYDKWYDGDRKKLVAVYRTNGGKWLEESLRQTSKFADHIIIHFCRAKENMSDQRMIELMQEFPKIIKYEFYEGPFQEDYERGWLLDEALKLHGLGEADWCISVDDDELYEDKFTERAQKLMNPRDPEVLGYWCQWRTIWTQELGKEYYRKDSTFGAFSNYRFFRLIPGQKITTDHPEGHHCGSSPVLAPENLRWTGIRVKHMGYDTPEQRQRKYDFYQKNDTYKSAADIGYEDYRHLIEKNVKLEEYHADHGISLTMIVKNEDGLIASCLEAVQYIVDEIIIVDTGSTDNTIEQINNFAEFSPVPVKLLHQEWTGNFALHRNFAKRHATQKWLLHLDADERFAPEEVAKVFRLTENEVNAIVFTIYNYLEKKQAGKPPKIAPTESFRLIRNVPEIYYTGLVHETPGDALMVLNRKKKLNVIGADFPLHHHGYLKSKEKVRAKFDHYEKINFLQAELSEGMDPKPYYQIAMHWLNDGKEHEALEMFQKALAIKPNFWQAAQQMAALNIKSAKSFLRTAIGGMPANHGARNQTITLLNYLEENCHGIQKKG